MTYDELVSPLMEFFGQGASDQLGTRKRDAQGNIKRNNWDKLTGRSQDELNEAARTRLSNTDLAEEYKRLSKTENLPNDMRSGQLRTEVSTLQGVEDATKAYLRVRGNRGRGAVDGMSEDEIYNLINEVNVKTEEKDAQKPGGRLERMEESDRRYYASQERSDKLLAANMAQQSGQLALANLRADNQMQIAQMNNQLQMRRQDSADRRADRRDRQAMIQQLMGGLSALGTSIAI